MSEQRKMRADLRQGLHQFLMQIYFSYTQSMDKKAAIEQISEILHEQHEYFTGTVIADSSSSGAVGELQELSKKLEQKVNQALTEYDRMTIIQQLEAVQVALELLTQERGN